MKKYKVLLLGSVNGAKQTMMSALKGEDSSDSGVSMDTIGMDFTKIVSPDGESCIEIWDTAGQKRFKTITEDYLGKVDSICLVFDPSDRRSFETIRNWNGQIQDMSSSRGLILVAVNGNSTGKEIQVSDEDAAAYASTYNIPYFNMKNLSDCRCIFMNSAEEIMEIHPESSKASDEITGPGLALVILKKGIRTTTPSSEIASALRNTASSRTSRVMQDLLTGIAANLTQRFSNVLFQVITGQYSGMGTALTAPAAALPPTSFFGRFFFSPRLIKDVAIPQMTPAAALRSNITACQDEINGILDTYLERNTSGPLSEIATKFRNSESLSKEEFDTLENSWSNPLKNLLKECVTRHSGITANRLDAYLQAIGYEKKEAGYIFNNAKAAAPDMSRS